MWERGRGGENEGGGKERAPKYFGLEPPMDTARPTALTRAVNVGDVYHRVGQKCDAANARSIILQYQVSTTVMMDLIVVYTHNFISPRCGSKREYKKTELN